MMRLLYLVCLSVATTTFAQEREQKDPPKEVEYYLNLCAEHYAKQENDKAIKVLDEAVRLFPKNALVFSCRGALHFTTKQYDRAISDTDEAIRLEPKQATSGYYIRGSAYYMKKEYAKAVKDLDEAIRLDSNSVDGLNGRAWAAATCPEAKFRDNKMALEYAKRACELTEWKQPFCLGTLAAAYAANGDFDQAIKWQRQVLEDQDYLKEYGEKGRKMLQLFAQKKPYQGD